MDPKVQGPYGFAIALVDKSNAFVAPVLFEGVRSQSDIRAEYNADEDNLDRQRLTSARYPYAKVVVFVVLYLREIQRHVLSVGEPSCIELVGAIMSCSSRFFCRLCFIGGPDLVLCHYGKSTGVRLCSSYCRENTYSAMFPIQGELLRTATLCRANDNVEYLVAGSDTCTTRDGRCVQTFLCR